MKCPKCHEGTVSIDKRVKKTRRRVVMSVMCKACFKWSRVEVPINVKAYVPSVAASPWVDAYREQWGVEP